MAENATDKETFKSSPIFDAVVEHWSKSRIDSPLVAIARYDDAAKQLIALGGVLQGLYFAAFAVGKLDEKLTILWALPLFISVLAVIFCAAQCVCRFHLSAEAKGAYQLLLRGRGEGLDIEELNRAMEQWCRRIDGIAEKKSRWLHWANRFFILATALALITLLAFTLSAGT